MTVPPQEEPREPIAAAAPTWGPTLFVWATWAGLLAAALVFVVHFGINLPQGDDWCEIVPVLTGEQPVTLAYLWSQHNEHRIFLPRIIQIGLTRAAGNDFRGGMFFNVAVAAALAGGLILAARKGRGHLLYSDAFFPLVLLHWGHQDGLLRADTTGNVLATALACAVLVFQVRHRAAFSPRTAILVGLSLLLLPLCGANGLGLVPLLALWLAFAGVCQWRSGDPHSRRAGRLMLAFAAAALLETGLYCAGLRSGPHYSSSLGLKLQTSLEFLTNSLGLGAFLVWPASGFIILGLLLATLGLLAFVWFRRPGERFRALGLLAFLGAVVSLALGLGWGRAGLAPFAGFAPRYVVLAVPVLCAFYFTWEIYSPRAVRGLVPMCLFVLAGVVCTWNFQTGQAQALSQSQMAAAFERDLHNGLPAADLARRHRDIFPFDPAVFVPRLEKLLDLGVGPFRR